MSYNINSVDAVVLEAYMKASDILLILKEDQLPESNFLEDLSDAAYAAFEEKDYERLIPLENFTWVGSFSGNSLDYLKEKIIPKIIGRIEAIFIWEGGDSIDGLAIKDGEFVECEVTQRLILPEGW